MRPVQLLDVRFGLISTLSLCPIWIDMLVNLNRSLAAFLFSLMCVRRALLRHSVILVGVFFSIQVHAYSVIVHNLVNELRHIIVLCHYHATRRCAVVFVVYVLLMLDWVFSA